MAKAKKDALSPDENAIIPRHRTAEQGISGLKISNKKILEESHRAFRYPAFISTVHEMRNNTTVGAALNVYNFFMTSHQWRVQEPIGATKKEIERAKAVGTMMNDMEHSWEEFISSVIPFLEYGFAVNEIVPYRRLNRNGSKHNDGLLGIRKLATRSQETISGWQFSDDGSKLLKILQDPKFLENQHLYQSKLNENGVLEMDREKCLLFTTGSTKGNPEGNSILKNIYLAYKQLTLLQENLLIGVAKDASGLLKIEIPANYLNPEGSDAEKATASAFMQIVDNYDKGTQKALLLPQLVDQESKLKMFDYGVLENKSIVRYDIESIIKGFQNDILTALSVDILKLGADGSGSFALSESKTSILTMAVDARMKEIRTVLNQHLMRYIYEMNGWETTNLPSFEYSKNEDLDLETFSSAIQRLAATNMIEVDREVLNRIRVAIGVAPKPDNEPVDKENLSASLAGKESKSGAGMAAGSGNGTAKIGGDSAPTDKSVANKGNAP